MNRERIITAWDHVVKVEQVSKKTGHTIEAMEYPRRGFPLNTCDPNTVVIPGKRGDPNNLNNLINGEEL